MARPPSHNLVARHQGFTLLELLVVITLVVVLFATAIENLLPLTGEAERVAVEQNRVAIDTALRGEAAERLVKQGAGSVRALGAVNPVELLRRPPGDYVGEHPDTEAEDVPPGSWYWDPANRWLVYRVRHARYFHTELDGPPRIRFHLARDGGDRFFVLHLESDADYHWETEGAEITRWLPSEE